jgi:cytochrome c oxidase subunit 3
MLAGAITAFWHQKGVPEPVEGRVPGNMAIWVAIFSEMSEFALMFLVYFIAKVHFLEIFNEGPTRLNTTAGALNTLALLSSSYFVAKSVQSVRLNQIKTAANWLWGAILAGCCYLSVKYWEYMWNSEQGLDVDTNLFFSLYYYMTFNHFLHVGWGSGALLWGIYRLKQGAYTPDSHEGLETIASYWHMIDLAWIIIFPLLYVLR